MERFSTDGKINWSKVFFIPMGLTMLGMLTLALLFR